MNLQFLNMQKKAAELGNVEAMSALGSCYQQGIGTEINESKAFEWYKKAAYLGNPSAMNLVADCYEKGFTQVEALLEKAYRAFFNV